MLMVPVRPSSPMAPGASEPLAPQRSTDWPVTAPPPLLLMVNEPEEALTTRLALAATPLRANDGADQTTPAALPNGPAVRFAAADEPAGAAPVPGPTMVPTPPAPV